MADFEDVQHTGGTITINRRGKQYQLSYVHQRPVRMVMAQLIVSSEGTPLGYAPFHGMGWQPEPEPEFMVFFASDEEGMFGQQCPACTSYFRSTSSSSSHCPYCGATPGPMAFFTSAQRLFFKAFAKAILTAPEGETRVNLDQLLDAIPENKQNPWRYAEQRQQTHFKCDRCKCAFDVLGEYVQCPDCPQTTHSRVVANKLAERLAEFETATASLTDRTERGNRWQQLLVGCVADFDGFASDIRDRLRRLPATPSRKQALGQLSFQNVVKAAERLDQWYGIDILKGIASDDREFLNVMFNRRHLFVHRAGRVDQEYLDNSGDTSARLNQVVRLKSGMISRLIPLLKISAAHFVSGVEAID